EGGAALRGVGARAPRGRELGRRQDEEWLALATGAGMAAAPPPASPKFQSGYLLAAPPFFALPCPPVWRRWWVWAVGISVTPEFSLVLPRTAVLYAPWGLTTLASVMVFLAWFRRRFWSIARPTPGVPG